MYKELFEILCFVSESLFSKFELQLSIENEIII